ncbi:hypothetical protein D9M68_601880 [compost metagenome]
MTKIKAGRIIRVENTQAKPNEATHYNLIWVEDENGKNERPIFLTDHELEMISARTDKNIEDWGKKGWLTDLLD